MKKFFTLLALIFIPAYFWTAENLCAATALAPEHPRLCFRTSVYSSAPSVGEVARRVSSPPYEHWFARLNEQGFHTAAMAFQEALQAAPRSVSLFCLYLDQATGEGKHSACAVGTQGDCVNGDPILYQGKHLTAIPGV